MSIGKRKVTVAEVAAEVAALNPPLTVERLMENIEVDSADPSRVVGILWWRSMRIKMLPDIIGSLTIGDNLDLGYNQLASLPEGFGSLTVGGGLNLVSNQLTSLPEGFGFLTVGRDVYLNSNRLALVLEEDEWF